ncbi:MFS transporter [Nocardiopsis sp. FIRDI 009]|uniref:MFS transporter n=1 Tax=Nocardiopsis sp. FIRDI 009 TaxID=714197 RepID=UPI000E25B0AC|nr:MFS transporter [Nocardiopsis sp. FIRDI 009]
MTVPAFRRLYLLVIVLHLVSDVALSPFYPQLFERLFGVTDMSATGTYIWVCRVTALVAMPLWGLVARRFPMATLVTWGLGISAVLELMIAAAPTYTVFTVLSAVQVAVTMSFALAYPAFVGSGNDRMRDVMAHTYIINVGTVTATVLGAGIMALPNPRWGIAACALLYVALAVLCHRHLPRGRAGEPAVRDEPACGGDAEHPADGGPPTRSTGARPARRWSRPALLLPLAAVCAAVLAAESARLVVRPFFTLYAEDSGIGPTVAAALFLLPQLTVLAVLPLAGRVHTVLGRALLPIACSVAALGLLVQFLAPDLALLTLGRVVFGAGLGLGHVALDLRVFAVTRARGPAFAAVETVRVGATLISPLLATGLATAGLGLPLAAGAGLFAVLSLLLIALPEGPAEDAAAADPAGGPRAARTPPTTHETDPAPARDPRARNREEEDQHVH